jgi:hypothetical protein
VQNADKLQMSPLFRAPHEDVVLDG